MAPHKRRRGTSPDENDAAVRKHTKKRAEEKKKKSKKSHDAKKEIEDDYMMNERIMKERLLKKHAIAEPVAGEADVEEIHLEEADVEEADVEEADVEEVDVEKPVVWKSAMEVDEIEVDEKIPRKREKTSYTAASRRIWTHPVKIEDLDLHVSHVNDRPTPLEAEYARYMAALAETAGKYADAEEDVEDEKEEEQATPQEPFRRKRWINHGPTINDIHDAPQDWSENEPDIHPLNYEAQIERCHERIQDNILPAIFKAKIEKFQKLKASLEEAQAERAQKYPGLDLATVTRVEGLVKMLAILEEKGEDPYEQVINIKALITAYTEGTLKWYGHGFVTYWSCGIQRSEPRGFKMEEFACLSGHFPRKSFWMEGLTGPTSNQCGMSHHKYVDDVNSNNPQSHANYIRISIKLPSGWYYNPLTFMQDTGSTFMTVYENDLQHLQKLDEALPRVGGIQLPFIVCHGYVSLETIGGDVVLPLTMLQVCLHEESSGEEMTTWDEIQAAVLPGERTLVGGVRTGTPRLDGAWPRWKLYRGSAPIPIGSSTFVAGLKTHMTRPIPVSTLGYGKAHAMTALGPVLPFVANPLNPPEANFPGPALLAPAGPVPLVGLGRAAATRPPWSGLTPLTPQNVVPTPIGHPVIPKAKQLPISEPGWSMTLDRPPAIAAAPCYWDA